MQDWPVDRQIDSRIGLWTGADLDSIAITPIGRPRSTTLDILLLWKGFPTYASMQTSFTILKADWLYLEQNQYKQTGMLQAYSAYSHSGIASYSVCCAASGV